MSDISAFAEWEAQNRTLSQEQTSQEAQRWKEMDGAKDSSNDPYSDGYESEGEESGRYSVRKTFAPSTSQSREEWMANPMENPPPPARKNTALKPIRHISPDLDEPEGSEMVVWLLPEVQAELEEEKKFRRYFLHSERRAVEAYAKEHPFYTQSGTVRCESAIEEYENDIYIFARAAGMGKQAARVEVKRAKATWEKSAGVADGLQWDLESDSELEIFKAPRLKNAVGHYPETVDVHMQNATDVANAAPMMNVAPGSAGMKRKRGELRDRKTEKEQVIEQMKFVKRPKEKEKKAKKKEQKDKKLAKQAEKKNNLARGSNLPSSLGNLDGKGEGGNVNNGTADDDVIAPTFHQVHSTLYGEATKLRPKSAPTTSAYFAKAAIPNAEGKMSTIISNSVERPKTPADGASKRKRKRKRNNNRLSDSRNKPMASDQRIHDPEHFHDQQQQQQHESSQMQVKKRPRTHDFPLPEEPTSELLGLDGLHPVESMNTAQSTDSELQNGADKIKVILKTSSDEYPIPRSDESTVPKLSNSEPEKIGREEAMQILVDEVNIPSQQIPLVPKNGAAQKQKQMRRDRGRRRRRLSTSAENKAEGGALEPLIELNNTNSKSPKLQTSGEGSSNQVLGIDIIQVLKYRHS